MSEKAKIEGTNEAWESRELGSDEDFVKPSKISEDAIDKAAELQLISIRLQKSLIEDFKLIGKINGIGYQTLMRQILKRFAASEIKKLLRECVLNKEEEMERYTNDLLGLENIVPGKPIELGTGKETFSSKLKDSLKNVGHEFQFFKGRGPYEKDFNDRVVKWYLSRMAKARYLPMVDYLKKVNLKRKTL